MNGYLTYNFTLIWNGIWIKVHLGSNSAVTARFRHVRPCPVTGLCRCRSPLPACATSGLPAFSIFMRDRDDDSARKMGLIAGPGTVGGAEAEMRVIASPK